MDKRDPIEQVRILAMAHVDAREIRRLAVLEPLDALVRRLHPCLQQTHLVCAHRAQQDGLLGPMDAYVSGQMQKLPATSVLLLFLVGVGIHVQKLLNCQTVDLCNVLVVHGRVLVALRALLVAQVHGVASFGVRGRKHVQLGAVLANRGRDLHGGRVVDRVVAVVWLALQWRIHH